jgi:hypothetical protein
VRTHLLPRAGGLQERAMSDFIYILVTIGFFALACWYAVACDRL